MFEEIDTDPRVVPELLEIMDDVYLDAGVLFSTGLPKSSFSTLGDFFSSAAAYCFLYFSAILKIAKFFG